MFQNYLVWVCVCLNGAGLSHNQLLLAAKHEHKKRFFKKSAHQKIESYYYRKGKEMGQLAYFVVVFHILLDASTKLPMMFLSKIELRQLVGKTSHNMTLSEIPPSHPLAPSWTTALTPTPVSLLTHSPLLFGSRAPTQKSRKKYLLLWAWFTSTESPFWITCPPVWSSLRPWDPQQNNCFRPKGVSILS